jgi:hypothetical protein
MWVRKSNEQMAGETRERSRVWRSFRGPAVLFIIWFLFSIFVELKGSPSSLCELLCVAAFIATVVAIASYVLQVMYGRKLDLWTIRANSVICDTCYRVKRLDGDNKCGCGGSFENFDNWAWVEDLKRTE